MIWKISKFFLTKNGTQIIHSTRGSQRWADVFLFHKPIPFTRYYNVRELNLHVAFIMYDGRSYKICPNDLWRGMKDWWCWNDVPKCVSNPFMLWIMPLMIKGRLSFTKVDTRSHGPVFYTIFLYKCVLWSVLVLTWYLDIFSSLWGVPKIFLCHLD